MTLTHRPLVVVLSFAAFACGGTTPTPTSTTAGTTTTAPPPAPASHGEEHAAPAPTSDPGPTPPVESAPPDLLAEERAAYERARPDDEPGAVQGDELQAIAAWADAFDRAHAAGVHGEHGGHAH